MRRLWRIAAALLLGVTPVARGEAQGATNIRAGLSVTPDSVRVGDPFHVTVRIRAPRGARIDFPEGTDSTAAVQSLDPVAVRTTADTTALEQYADYRVAAWDVGRLPIRLPDAVVRIGGSERRVSLGGYAVFVKTVLPEDTTLRVPKPPRAIYEISPFPWWWLLLAAAVIILGLLLWWWWRRRRRKPAVVIPIDPYGRAIGEFTRIEKLGLLEAGERGRYVALMVEVLRDYLSSRYTEARLSHTSTELLVAVRGQRFIMHERLTRVLGETDLIKFARRAVSSDRARELGREARAIVDREHTASQPAQEAAA